MVTRRALRAFSTIISVRRAADRRRRPHPGDPWRHALAADRSGPMDLGGVPGLDLPSKRSAASCGAWAFASSRHVQERVRIENRIAALLTTQGVRERPSLRSWQKDMECGPETASRSRPIYASR